MAIYNGMGFAINTDPVSRMSRPQVSGPIVTGTYNPDWNKTATTTAAKTTTTTDPYAAYLDAMRKEQAAALERQRSSAFDVMQSILSDFGIDMDGSGLAATI